MRRNEPAQIVFKPGINVQYTSTLNEAGWSDGNLIRFRDGLPEQLGGWQKLTEAQIVGTARCLFAWQDLSAYPYLGIGTNSRLQVYTPGVINDITPLRDTVNQAPSFNTTSGSATVTVNDNAHGAAVGDWVRIVNAISVGGLILQGFYQVVTVPGANTYTITAAQNATSTVAAGGAAVLFNTTNTLTSVTVTLNNHGFAVTDLFTVAISTAVGGITFTGEYAVQSVLSANQFTITASVAASSTTSGSENAGQVRLQYLIASGLESSELQTGYGTGTYGSGFYGISSSTAGVNPLRTWSMDAWGEFLLAAPSRGAVYAWDPTTGFLPAVVVSGAPAQNRQILVATPQRQLVSLGSEVLGVFDPLLIRYSDVDDYTDFVASATNQAGSNRLPSGSAIIGGLTFDLGVYIWTDADMWTMRYQGLPFVYGFNKVGTNCGLISQRAVAAMGGWMYWMGQKGFFRSNGNGAEPVPCSVWDFVFKDLDELQSDKIHCAANTLFGELCWYFPSADGAGEIDSYVKFNTIDGVWDKGTLVRTAWVDRSVLGNPIGADGAKYLQQHETTKTADGALLESWIESGNAALTGGGTQITIDRVLPDFTLEDGAGLINMTITARNAPNEAGWTVGPFSMTATTDWFRPRVKGRTASFKLQAAEAGTFWRLGLIRYEWSQGGGL
jgi:hypothetical protein